MERCSKERLTVVDRQIRPINVFDGQVDIIIVGWLVMQKSLLLIPSRKVVHRLQEGDVDERFALNVASIDA